MQMLLRLWRRPRLTNHDMSGSMAAQLFPIYQAALDTHTVTFGMVVTARAVTRGLQRMSAQQCKACDYYYPKLVSEFAKSRRIKQVYFPTHFVGGLILTEEARSFLRIHRPAILTMDGVCNSTDPLAIRRFGFELDHVLIEARGHLLGQAQRHAIEEIFSTYTFILGEMDRFAKEPRAYQDQADKIAEFSSMVTQVATNVRREATRQAQNRYLLGVALGLAALAGITAILAPFLAGALVNTLSVSTLLGGLVAGGLGTLLSVMFRMSSGDVLVEWQAGSATVVVLGLFRPLIGALSSAALYLLLKTGVISLIGAGSGASEPFYWAVGFLAGFSERWVPDMLASTSRSVKPAN
jgi:hypothetical protein